MWLRRAAVAVATPGSASPHLCAGFAARAAAARSKLSAAAAVAEVKGAAKAKFDETVEIAVRLGVDPRKPNQNVRTTTLLPHGTGKVVRVAVFCQHEGQVEEALAAGADLAGSEELIAAVQGGTIDFDRCIATPDMMAKLGKIARVSVCRPGSLSATLLPLLGHRPPFLLLLLLLLLLLTLLPHRHRPPQKKTSLPRAHQILGPRGMMPNPKLGSVTKDVATGVKALKGGQVQFRTEKNGIVHAGIGKVSFDDAALVENLRAFMVALTNAKPEGQKGKYIIGAHLSSTMGPGQELDVALVDPASPRFMQ